MAGSWFLMWRCGGAVLVDDRADLPPACPEHPAAERLAPAEHVGQVAAHMPRGLDHGAATAPVYVGTADSSARGVNVDHLVADTVTWRAHCGKRVAEPRPCPPNLLAEEVTCRTCRRALP